MSDSPDTSAARIAAYQDGKRAGLAIAALAIAILAFIDLLNVEKSILAIVLAILALRGTTDHGVVRRWARSAIVIAIVQVIALAVLITIYHSVFVQVFRLLQKFR